MFMVGAHIVDRLLAGGGELVTIVTGSDEGARDVGDRVGDYLRASRPDVEVMTYDGGQPRYPLLIGVE
jgi:dihydroxyacetone kinase-like predicted kinase